MSILIKNTNYRDITPVMTGKSTPVPYAVECSITTINDFWKTLDGNDNTYFRSNISTTVPFYLKIDFGSGNEKKIAGYTLNCSYNVQWTMNSWDLEGSNDNNTWDTLDTRSNIVWTTNAKQQFVFSNTLKYRYYRFKVTKKNGTNSVCINSINFLEEEEGTKLEFHKVKKENLPSNKADGIDSLYFTDEGEIYLTDKNGDLVQCGGKSTSDVKISSEENNAVQSKDDGLYVKDLSDDVNKIRIAQHTVNSQLEYCNCKLGDAGENDVIKTDDIMKFTPINKNGLEYNSINHSILLKKGRTYKISADMQCNIYNNGSVAFAIYNLSKSANMISFHKTVSSNTAESCASITYTPDTDNEEIVIKAVAVSTSATLTKIPTEYSWFSIEEIGRAITIDPVEYVNNESGIEDTPVGEIITRLGNTPPKHYLLCNGKEYNITDYPDLAQHFIDEFGISNYFGGDGETTFAVPDLMDKTVVYRQLQMTSNTEPSPLEATASSEHNINFPAYKLFDNNQMTEWHDAYTLSDGNEWVQINFNSPTKVSAFRMLPRISADYPEQSPKNIRLLGSNDGENFDTLCEYTDLTFSSKTYKEFMLDDIYTYKIYRLFMYGGSRDKTNLLVYSFSQLEFGIFKSITAIKYEPTYFMKNNYDAMNIYSKDEVIVGKWFDGRPVYKTTIQSTLPDVSTTGTRVDKEIPFDANIDTMVDIHYIFNTSTSAWNCYESSQSTARCYYDKSKKSVWLYNMHKAWNGADVYITLLYTKTTDSTS